MQMVTAISISFFAILVFSGCASMTGDGSDQTILLRSVPTGATIYVDGQKVGRTPEFVQVARRAKPRVELDSKTGRREYKLPTRYRWGRSFASGFVFLTYAPIAWAIDFLTGTAWDVRDSEPLEVELSKADAQNPKPERKPLEVVVAPPRSSSVAMSDDGGHALEKLLNEKSKVTAVEKVRPYDETLPNFIDNDYEYSTSNMNSRRRLMRSLRADVVYESYIEPDDEGWVLKSEARDVYGPGSHPGPTIRLSRDAEGPRVFGVGFGLKPWWSRILPDTVGVDFVDEKLNVDVMGQTYRLTPVYGNEWWATGIRYASAVNISSTPDRRREFGSRWDFSAVPSFKFSRKTVKAEGLPAVAGQFTEIDPQFTRWAITGGYGLEVGYLSGRHFFYFDLIPVFQWSQISWRQNSQDRDATRTSVTAQSEFGYSYVFDSGWLLRLFTRTQGENVELWKDALVSRMGAAYTPSAAQAIVSGVTLGYRFEADRFQMAPSQAAGK